MDPYRPRRKNKGIQAQKMALHDIKHRLSSDVGSLLVLIKEGQQEQIATAQQKAKNDFIKHSSEMQKIAQKMGEHYVKLVRDYLNSVDEIVHARSAWIDDAKIRHCHSMSEKLDKEISAA